MRLIFGIFFIIASFIGVIFFKHYIGKIIAFPSLWYLFFIGLGVLGLWLFIGVFKKASRQADNSFNLAMENLKAHSERIELNFDFCEFKSGSYSCQIEDENVSSLKWFAPGQMTYLTGETVNKDMVQSYLIYTHNTGHSLEKYISQSFPVDHKTLGFYVINNDIILYVSRLDRSKYYFDLKK